MCNIGEKGAAVSRFGAQGLWLIIPEGLFGTCDCF